MTSLSLDGIRRRLGDSMFSSVAGPEGPQRRDRLQRPGPRWFDDDRPIRRVHGDASMLIGGLRALLLQSLHPLAMAGVAQHSGFKGDPWGRVQRTSHFLAVTTFGTASDAEAMVRGIRGIHERVRGTAPDGRPYTATDPHLLHWVHLAGLDSFLAAYQRFGDRPLDPDEQDGYVADTALVALKLGVLDPPMTVGELRDQLADYRPELSSTPEARDTARFILLSPPLPLVARGPYGVLGAAAVSLLPAWARWPLRVPYLPVTEAVAVRAAGTVVTRTIRWAMAPDQ